MLATVHGISMNFGVVHGSFDVAHVTPSGVSSPCVVGLEGQYPVVVFHSGFKFREVSPVQVAQIGQDWNAIFVGFEHGKKHFFCRTKRTFEHEVFGFVKHLELLFREVVGVFEGVVGHAAHQWEKTEENEPFCPQTYPLV